MEANWPIRLFSKSVLKQRKLSEVAGMLGPLDNLRCLDLGGDSGVISYMLRQRGGRWASADLDERSVRAIEQLVHSDVHLFAGGRAPFADAEFDRVAVVDYLEHVHDDGAFIRELRRIVRPDGEVVFNVPRVNNGLARRLRLALGQTDAKHGHVRPGYTVESLQALLGDCFTLQAHHTYSKFFSELIDALMVYAVSRLKKRRAGPAEDESKKGLFVTGQDLSANRSMFKAYSLIYPLVWLVAKLDRLLVFGDGCMLIAQARANEPARSPVSGGVFGA